MSTSGVTRGDIEALRCEAANAGDTVQAALCMAALAGDQEAVARCVRVIQDARIAGDEPVRYTEAARDLAGYLSDYAADDGSDLHLIVQQWLRDNGVEATLYQEGTYS
jgi:hypothetical protein